MASRSIKPESKSHSSQLGDSMHQGAAKAMSVPHGLAASMKQGSPTPKATGAAKEIGARMRQGGK